MPFAYNRGVKLIFHRESHLPHDCLQTAECNFRTVVTFIQLQETRLFQGGFINITSTRITELPIWSNE